MQKSVTLIAALTGLSLLSTAVFATPPADPDKQWACSADENGHWQCEQRDRSQKSSSAPLTVAAASKTQVEPLKNEPLNEKYTQWYWVPAQDLSSDCDTKPGCDGAYVLPDNIVIDNNIDPENAPTHISADTSDMQGDNVDLAGNVVITQGNRQIKTETAHINTASNKFNLDGGFEIQQPGVLVAGRSAAFDSKTGIGYFDQARYLSLTTGMRVTGEKIAHSSADILEIEQASYTQCTPDDEVWKLEASNITLDNSTGFGSAKHARLNLFDVPILYSPYLTFPIDDRRMSGLLMPTLRYSSDDGAEVSVPIYFNLAPNYDATYIPRYIEKRGVLNQLETRYLNQTGSWVLSGGRLNEDEYIADDPTVPPVDGHIREYETGMDRWVGSVNHVGRFAQNWSTRIDYTKISDSDFFQDFDTSGLEIKKIQQLNQKAELAFNNQDWLARLSAQQYQTVNNDIAVPYKQLPRLLIENLTGASNFSPDWLFKTEFTAFDHLDSFDEGGNKTTGNRSYTEAGVSFPMNWAQGFIIPTLKVRHLAYQLDTPDIEDPNTDYDPNVTTGLGTLDMGLFFERQTTFSQSAYTQTLEPRLYYFAGESKDQQDLPDFDTSQLQFTYNQLFRDTRFSGNDRLDGGNRLSVAVTTRFLENDSGRETFSLSMGEIFYFEDRTVSVGPSTPEDTRPNSNFALQLQYNPRDNLFISHNLQWDHREGNVDEANVGLQYRHASDAIFHAGYLFRRDGAKLSGTAPRNLEQFDLSMILPVTNQWTFFSRVKYDATENRALLDTTGIEYEDCCWLTRIVYQREVEDEFLGNDGRIEIERDYAFVLEFQLKGLGSLLGGEAGSLLEKSILGYISDD